MWRQTDTDDKVSTKTSFIFIPLNNLYLSYHVLEECQIFNFEKMVLVSSFCGRLSNITNNIKMLLDMVVEKYEHP